MSPMYVPRTPIESARSVELSPAVPPDFDVLASATSFVTSLGNISSELLQSMHPTRVDTLIEALDEAKSASRSIFAHLRAQVDDARKELEVTRTTFRRVEDLWTLVAESAEANLRADGVSVDDELLLQLTHTRRLSRHSADSQSTVVSITGHVSKTERPKSADSEAYFSVVKYKDASTSTTCAPLNILIPPTVVTGTRAAFWPEWLDSLIPSPDNSAMNTPTDAERHDFDFFHRSANSNLRKEGKRPHTSHALMGIMRSAKDKEWDESKMVVKSTLDVTAKNGSPSGSSRLKTWLKKRIIPDYQKSVKVEIVLDIDEAACSVGRQVKPAAMDQAPVPLPSERHSRDRNVPLNGQMQAHLIALITTSRDIGSIEECIAAASQFVTTADRSLVRAERIAQRALASRGSAIQHLRSAHESLSLPNSKFLIPPQNPPSFHESSGPPSSPSSTDSSPFASKRSSRVSLISSPAVYDDEDTRALRGLLLRKINARLDGSFDEIDKATMWLRIVREVVRVVKYGAGL